MNTAANIVARTQTIIDGYYDAGTDQESVTVSAGIPTPGDPPMITDGQDTYYSKGLKIKFASPWSDACSITIDMTDAQGWTVVGWATEGDSQYQATIPADTITQALTFQTKTIVYFMFQETASNRIHDPGIRVTPT